MHYSRHRLTASVTTWLHSRTRQPMTNGLALLAHWSVTSLCACLCRTGRPLCWDRCAESLRVELLVTKRQMARWWIVCEESADGSRCRWLIFRPQPPRPILPWRTTDLTASPSRSARWNNTPVCYVVKWLNVQRSLPTQDVPFFNLFPVPPPLPQRLRFGQFFADIIVRFMNLLTYIYYLLYLLTYFVGNPS